MKLKISEDADVNYLASVIKIVDIKDHPNADRLSLTEVFGNTVILAKGSYEIGEVCVYFPVESCLHPKFLSWANLYDKPELNSDGKTKGFFSNKGNRVKAVKLREIPSQGFLFKVSELAKYYGVSPNIFSVGESFNVVGEDLLVTKYIRPDRSDRSVQNQASTKNKIPNWVNSILGFLPRPIRTVLFKPVKWYFGLSKDDGIKSLIVDGQFKFHYKTEHLGKNIWLIKPHDYITITSKLHGTSAIFSNILCKKPLSIFQSMRKYMGFDVVEFEYKEVYSSRSVLKNRRDNKHTDDVWGKHMAELSGNISPGISMYGEIVGYSSPN
jgi:tRNA-binding EMAP/Myf-like protein